MIISGEIDAFASLLHWGIFCVGTKIVFPISKVNSMADSTESKVVPWTLAPPSPVFQYFQLHRDKKVLAKIYGLFYGAKTYLFILLPS